MSARLQRGPLPGLAPASLPPTRPAHTTIRPCDTRAYRCFVTSCQCPRPYCRSPPPPALPPPPARATCLQWGPCLPVITSCQSPSPLPPPPACGTRLQQGLCLLLLCCHPLMPVPTTALPPPPAHATCLLWGLCLPLLCHLLLRPQTPPLLCHHLLLPCCHLVLVWLASNEARAYHSPATSLSRDSPPTRLGHGLSGISFNASGTLAELSNMHFFTYYSLYPLYTQFLSLHTFVSFELLLVS